MEEKNKRPFVGHIVEGRPVIISDLQKAGLVKPDKEDGVKYFLSCPNCNSDDIRPVEKGYYCGRCDTMFEKKEH
jgi:hypothetical protein